MKTAVKSPTSPDCRCKPGILLTETLSTEAPQHFFLTLFPRNLHFPALRSGPTAVSGATRQKQNPCSQLNPLSSCCLLFVCIACLLTSSHLCALDENGDGHADYRSGEVLLEFKEESKTANKNQELKSDLSRVQEVFSKINRPALLKSCRSLQKEKPLPRKDAVASKKGRRAVLVRLDDTNADILELCETLASLPEVATAEPNYIYDHHSVPNDPFATSSGLWGQGFQDQWGLHLADVFAAWDTETQTNEVIVAVVDSGLDFNHPEMAGRFWTNPDEIAGNGIDDDNNGYIDDHRGWDFVADTNSPTDTHGHGTCVAGVIGAAGNNLQGMAGISRHCKIMVLKHGSAAINVADSAEAIRYAADNGAQVINLSFGGDIRSSVLESAINYAHDLDVVVVASAGNNATSSVPVYPADYVNTISVGSSNHLDLRTDFSNLGYKVDFMAPGGSDGGSGTGDTILTLRTSSGGIGTTVNSQYSRVRGTSFAGPFCCGVVAMMKNQRPTLTHDEIRSILRASCDDIDTTGWDEQTSYGRINASRALTYGSGLVTRITSPLLGNHLGGSVTISGNSYGTDFGQFILEYGAGDSPTVWNQIASSGTPVTGSTLGTWDTTGVADGNYVLRLRSVATDDATFEDRLQVTVSNYDPPLLSNIFPVSGGRNMSTADLNGDGIKEIIYGSSVYVVARNITTGGSLFIVNMGATTVGPPTIADIDNDGDLEILAIGNDSTGRNGTLRAFSHTGAAITALSKSFISANPFISYAISPVVGDVTGDGNLEICYTTGTTEFGGKAVVHLIDHQGNELPGWPVNLATNAVYSSPAMADTDGDGTPEIALISFSGDVYMLNASGTVVPGWPKKLGSSQVSGSVTFADVDHDGYQELIATSWEGYFAIYERNGTLLPNWPVDYGSITRPPAVADVDEDGDLEIAIGTQDGLVQLMHHDGTVLPGWPRTIPSRAYSPVICDVDGDDVLDVVTVDGNSTVHGWSMDGTVLYQAGFPISQGDINGGAPVVIDDISGDGKLELLAANTNSMFAYKLNQPDSPGRSPYPMMLLNQHRNAFYAKTLSIDGITPSGGETGQPLTVVVSGDHFLNGVTATVNGIEVPVTFGSVNEIVLEVPALLASGWHDVTFHSFDYPPVVHSKAIALVLDLQGDGDGDHLADGWELENGIDPFNNGSLDFLQGAYGDKDSDGMNNLLEFAFESLGLIPNIPDQHLLPRPMVSNGGLSLDYPNDTSKNLVYTPMASTDLVHWYSSGQVGAPDGFTDADLGTGTTPVQNRQAAVPMAETGRVFLKIKIEGQ